MKELKAIIQPFMFARVVEALREMKDLPGLTVSEVRGLGKQQAVDDSGEVLESYVDFTTKTKLEIVVPDEQVDCVLGVLREHARTGKPGDGKIFVYPVEEVVKIRTGERGEEAI